MQDFAPDHPEQGIAGIRMVFDADAASSDLAEVPEWVTTYRLTHVPLDQC